MKENPVDALLVSESDHFLPAAGPLVPANAFSPVYEYLNLPLAELGLPFQYTLNSPQRSSLANLAGCLDRAGFSCALADNIFRDPAEAKRFERLLRARPRVVGLSTSSLHRTESASAIAEKVHRLSPASIFVLGGSGLRFNAAMEAYADLVVDGDGEEALVALLRAVKTGAAAGDLERFLPAAVKNKAGVPHLGGSRNLSRGGFPAWKLYKNLPSACFPVEASKGCAHSCVFCSYPERGNQDYRPAAAVINEIKFLTGALGAKYLRFTDTNLTTDPAYVEELCRGLIRERLAVPWSCFARVDELAARPGLCSLMADAGCFWVYAGVESADAAILAGMKKGFGPEQIVRGVDSVKAAGMAFHGNFVTGFPGETEETLNRDYELIRSCGMDTVSFTVLGLTGPLAELAEERPEKFGHLARQGNHWKHSTMDFESARRAAAGLIRKTALAEGAPLVASHGIAMYYLLGGGLDFSGVMEYFSAVRDYHRAKSAGSPGAAAGPAEIIRAACERTSVKFGWTKPGPGRSPGGGNC